MNETRLSRLRNEFSHLDFMLHDVYIGIARTKCLRNHSTWKNTSKKWNDIFFVKAEETYFRTVISGTPCIRASAREIRARISFSRARTRGKKRKS